MAEPPRSQKNTLDSSRAALLLCTTIGSTVRIMLVAFAYEFPHRKTRDGLLRLVSHGIKVDLVIAAPWRNLGPKHAGIVPSDKVGFIPKTEIVCSEFGIDYISAAHESYEVVRVLEDRRPNFGVVLGARILPDKVINCFESGILNAHPGLLPENAGLDNIAWAINQRVPQGVTFHLINNQIDSGLVLNRVVVGEIPKQWRVEDLQRSLSELELKGIVDILRNWPDTALEGVDITGRSRYHRPLPKLHHYLARSRWPIYKSRYSRNLQEYLEHQGREVVVDASALITLN